MRSTRKRTAYSWLVTGCMVGVIGWSGSILYAQSAPKDQPKPAEQKEAQEKGDDFHFRFIPSSVQRNTNLGFDQSGRVTSANENMNINFRVQYQAGKLQPIAIKNIQVSKITTDTGESLTSRSQDREQALYSWESQSSRNQGQRSEFYLNLSLTQPSTLSQEITEMSGTMDVVYAQGEPSEALLSPFKDYDGKRITFKNLPGQYIIFTRDERQGDNQSRVRVAMPTDFRPYISRISFYDHTGRQLNYSGWGGGNDGSVEYRQLNIDLPDDGQIRVEINAKVVTRQVPFTITHVPLVDPGKKPQGGDIMVELKPIAPINAAITVKRLDVEVAE